MTIPLLQVDAFASEPFTGNPAAVCLLDAARDAAWMQSVAMEMNLAETAFLVPRSVAGESRGFDLRWFTPAIEVDLCGHATLASAHALWEMGRLPKTDPARFFTKSGWLTCTWSNGRIVMDFPARETQPVPAPEGLMLHLGLPASTRPLFVGQTVAQYLVVLDQETLVRNAKPDFAAIKRMPTHGVVITARGSKDYDFVSRFFAPGAGIDEDPVTGSAHCALGPYWATELGKTAFTAYQASARGGVVRVEVKGDRVLLGGTAVTVLKGELV